MERLQKVLAAAGIGSRRKCEQIIQEGRVQVNGETITELGTKVTPGTDAIMVDGRPIGSEKKVYLMFHKPKGCITSVTDPGGRKTVMDFMKDVKERVYPVGRLDYETEGLLLLTNDGEFANRLTHPKFHVPKTYHATVKGVPHGSVLEQLARGIKLEDGMTAPAVVEYHDIAANEQESIISITIHEGRNRQVRRMFESVNYPVIRLKRVQYGSLTLHGLARSKYRTLTASEVKELMNIRGERVKDT